jgi:precorrin-3B methylase
MFLSGRPDSATFCTTDTGKAMVQRVTTVAFQGIEGRAVDVQVQVAPGLPAFNVVGSRIRPCLRRGSAYGPH